MFLEEHRYSLKNLENSLNQIRETLNLSHSEMSDLAKARSFSKTSKLDLSEIDNLSNELNLSMFNLMTGEFCLDAIKKQYESDCSELSEKQIGNAGTKIRTIKNALNFFFHDDAAQLKKELQLTDAHLVNEDQEIDIKAIAHVFNRYAQRYFGIDSLEKIGVENGVRVTSDVLKNHFDSNQPFINNIELLLEECMSKIENNRDYFVIGKTSNRLSVKTSPKNGAYDFLESNPSCTAYFEKAISGYLYGMAKVFNEKIRVIKKLSRNDRATDSTFEIVFN